MSRHRYLISYDITDDRCRTQIYQILCDNGDRIQYSVFFCELNLTELAQIGMQLKPYVNHDHDQIMILDLGPADAAKQIGITCIGRAYSPRVRITVI